MIDYYDILGVPREASPDEIKRAYRKCASLYHPDREGGDHDKMQGVQKAYDVLSDPEKRKGFDAGEDPDAPTLDAQRAEVLAGLFLQALDTSGEDADLIEGMRSYYRQQKARAASDVAGHRQKIKQREKAITRLKRRAGENFIAGKLREDIALKSAQIDRLEAMSKEVDSLLAMLEEWSYAAAPPGAPTFGLGAYLSLSRAQCAD